MHSVETDARRTLHHAREHSQALMREITGQGPTKTLQRGFALVRDTEGRAITSAQNSPANITITFRDSQRAATLVPTTAP
jgi:exodeoxyribonuclease VII large subunit